MYSLADALGTRLGPGTKECPGKAFIAPLCAENCEAVKTALGWVDRRQLGRLTARAKCEGRALLKREQDKEPAVPLTGRAQAVYKLILEHGVLTGSKITGLTGIDQSTLTKTIIPELKKLRGIVNKRGAGYYSPSHYSPQ